MYNFQHLLRSLWEHVNCMANPITNELVPNSGHDFCNKHAKEFLGLLVRRFAVLDHGKGYSSHAGPAKFSRFIDCSFKGVKHHSMCASTCMSSHPAHAQHSGGVPTFMHQTHRPSTDRAVPKLPGYGRRAGNGSGFVAVSVNVKHMEQPWSATVTCAACAHTPNSETQCASQTLPRCSSSQATQPHLTLQDSFQLPRIIYTRPWACSFLGHHSSASIQQPNTS